MLTLYCHVDESGQTVAGHNFIIGAIVTVDQEKVRALLADVEIQSGKGFVKWRKTAYPRRVEYIRRILSTPEFRGALRFAVYPEKVERHDATVLAIAHAMQWNPPSGAFAIRVYVDALTKLQCLHYKTELRKHGLNVDKVRGVEKDENDALIRLADALAGLTSDMLDGSAGDDLQELYAQAKKRGFIVGV